MLKVEQIVTQTVVSYFKNSNSRVNYILSSNKGKVNFSFSDIQICGYNVGLDLSNKVFTVRWGCQHPSLRTIEKAIADLRGTTEKTTARGLRKISSKSTIIKQSVIEESENYFVTKTKAYLKSEYELYTYTVDNKVLSKSGGDIKFSGYSICTDTDRGKADLAEKLEYIFELINDLNEFVKEHGHESGSFRRN